MPPSPDPSSELLLRHGPYLRALARGLLGDDAAAEDVVQDTWAAFLRCPPREERMGSWLRRVTTHAALNRRRGEARRRERERSRARDDAAPSAAEVAERLAVQRRLSRAVDGLREPYATVVYLRFYEDLPPREIARRTGRPVETVRSQVRRALAMLREDLDGETPGGRRAWAGVLLPLARVELRRTPPLTASVGALATVAALVAVAAFVPRSAPLSMPAPRAPARPALEAALAPHELAGRTRQGASVVEPATRMAFRARALDSATGEPIPDLRVTARDSLGATATATTDVDGVAVGSAPLAPGVPSLEVRDGDGGPRVSFEVFETTDDTYELRAHVGPTYRLRIGGAEAGAELEARLSVLGDPRATGHHPPMAVRHDVRGAWVRFPPLLPPSQTRGGERAGLVLEVIGPSLGRAGSACVHPWPGRYPRPVAIDLEPRGSIAGRVTEVGGDGVGGVTVHARRGVTTAAAFSDPAGHFRLFPLEEGAWTIEVRSSAHATERRSFAVTAGAELAFDPTLERLPSGALEGRLASRSGRHVPIGAVRLRSTAEPWRSYEVTPLFCTFRFAGVPVGEYELLPPMGDAYAWEPARARVVVPGAPTTFTCQDDVPTDVLVVRARDAESGAELPSVRFALLVDRERRGTDAALALASPLEMRAVEAGAVACAALPRDLPVVWVVEAEGRRSARGTRADIVRARGRLAIDVALAPAPPLRLWFGTGDPDRGGRPLAGVEVLAGDHVLGRSLADGHVLLELAYDPGPIRARLHGWRVRRWTGFEDGRVVEPRFVHHVWLERVDAPPR